MDDDIDPVCREPEQPMSFDHLQPLVHQRCRIDRYLFPHVPLAAIEDPIEQTNLAFAFKHCLEELWENRNLREANWGDLLNILQAVLAQIEFEIFSGSQKLGIKKVVTEYLCKAEVTDLDMEDALGILSEAGFDPWRGISGKPQD